MPYTIDLPSGGTCTLLHAMELKAGDKAAVSVAIGESPARTQSGLVIAAKHAIAARSVIAWQVPYLPNAKVPRVDPERFDELEIADYDKILAATDETFTIMFPPPVTPDDADVPGSPTEPTGD